MPAAAHLNLCDPALRSRGIAHLSRVAPKLRPLLSTQLRFIPARESMFTHLCRVIIAQQVSVAAADAITKRFFSACNQRPRPLQVHGMDPQLLRQCGLSGSKVRYVQDLAQGICSDQHRLQRLATLSDQEVHQRLCAIRGIGPWSADMVLIFRLHRPDILPTLDIGLRRGMEQLYGLDPQASPQAFHQAATAIAEPWRPFRSLATRFIWAAGDADITY